MDGPSPTVVVAEHLTVVLAGHGPLHAALGTGGSRQFGRRCDGGGIANRGYRGFGIGVVNGTVLRCGSTNWV
jgi:hypothetical protein